MAQLPPISATSHTVDGPDSSQADQAGIYRATAWEMLEVAQLLLNTGAKVPRPIAYLCGHALEVGLKSALVGKCSPGEIRSLSHDLEKAWNRVRGIVPALGDMPPELKPLNDVHARPHHLRYQQDGEGNPIAVMVSPDPARVVPAVRRVLDLMEATASTC